jgi:iron uptake system component EfeO
LNRAISGNRRRIAALAAGAIAVAVAGCGGSDDESAATEATTTSEAAAVDQATLASAERSYDEFVERNAARLVRGTQAFVDAVDAGEIERAKQIYATSRAPFERIEPVAGAFGDLDPDIDGREGDIPADDWGGYHRIEKALWIDESTKGLEPITTELLDDVRNLHDIAIKASFDPAEIAQGSVDLLGEVSASKITGEEERYSRTDLWDFEANVQGAEAGFEALEPAVREADPELADEVSKQFEQTYAALDDYRRGQGFVLYYELSTDDTAGLSQRIDALAEPLSRVAATVG